MIVRLKNFCKSEKFVKSLKNIAVVFAYVIIAVALMSNFGFADDDDSTSLAGQKDLRTISVPTKDDVPKDNLTTMMWDGFERVQSVMLTFSIPAVVIAVGCGVFIKKFSMGKQDKIELGNKLIRDSIIGFIVINAMPTIAKTIYQFIRDEDKLNSEAMITYFKNFF